MISTSLRNHTEDLYFSRYKTFPIDSNLSKVIRKNFNINMYLRDDFKTINTIISDTLKYIWLGRGDLYSENSLYQWLIINEFNHDFEYDINPQINIINQYNRFSFYENDTYSVFMVNSLYNHKTYLTGGPLIASIIKNKITGKNLLIFGLVNAPGQSKLKSIKELESIILNSIF